MIFLSWSRGTGHMGPTTLLLMNSKATVFTHSLPKKWRIQYPWSLHPLLFRSNHFGLTLLISQLVSTRNSTKKLTFVVQLLMTTSPTLLIILELRVTEHLFQTVNILLLANFRFKFPSLKATSSLQDLAHLQT